MDLYAKSISRYLNMRVQVRMGTYVTVYGTLAEVNDDYLRLIDSRQAEEFDESQWFTRIAESDPDMVRSQADGETLIRLYCVASITCTSDELRFFPIGSSTSEEVQKGPSLGSFFGPNHEERIKEVSEEYAAFLESPASKEPAKSLEDQLRNNCDDIRIELGASLISVAKLVDGNAPLFARLSHLRQEIYDRLGIIVPKIRLKNSVHVPSDHYRILFWNAEVGRFAWKLNHCFIIPTLEVSEVDYPEREPAYGLPARWVHEDALTDVDKSFCREFEIVLATHLNRLIEQSPEQFLSLDGVAMLVDRVQECRPVLISETIPDPVSISLLHGVLIRMLREQIPIVAMPRIIEVVGRLAQSTQDPSAIYTQLRRLLGTIICDRYLNEERVLKVFQVESEAELLLREAMEQGKTVPFLSEWLTRIYKAAAGKGPIAILVSDSGIREYLWRALGADGIDFGVLASIEIPRNFQSEIVDILKIESEVGT